MLQAAGAKRVTLRTSFRARPNIQHAINAAFAPLMTGDLTCCKQNTCPSSRFAAIPKNSRRLSCFLCPSPMVTGDFQPRH